MGFTATPIAGQSRSLDSCPYHIRDLVRDTLDMIIQLFTDTQKLRDRYGCKEILSATTSGLLPRPPRDFGALENLAASFSHYRVNSEPAKKASRLTLETR